MGNSTEWIIGEVSKTLHEVSTHAIDLLKMMGPETGTFIEVLQSNLNEIDSEKLLRVAFIGQYSSGKSTLISALTGERNIRIDADIATDKATDYRWNGILLTDTPGLYTDRKDHDAVTEEAIRRADLLVFVITSDLFDDVILKNFEKLSYEHAYKNKLLLVVNKMSMESGDYEVLKNNYTEALAEAVRPHDFNDFNVSFIDAADYIEGLDDDIDELVEMSHFNTFVDQINQFTKERRLLGKLDRPVRFAMSELQKAAIHLTESEANRASNVIISRIEDRIQKSVKQCDRHIENQLGTLRAKIIRIGNDTSSSIGLEGTDAGLVQTQAENQLKDAISQAIENMASMLEEEQELLREEIDSIFDSDAGTAYLREIEYRHLELNEPSVNNMDEFAQGFKMVSNIVDKVGVGVFKSLGNSSNGVFKAGDVAGSTLHSVVYSVGKFFGADFKPWQAVNIAKNIGKAFKVLGTVMAFGGIILDVASMVQDRENAKKLVAARLDCATIFAQIASDIEVKLREGYENYRTEFYYSMLEDISVERDTQLEAQQNQTDAQQKLIEWSNTLKELIYNIGENSLEIV